MRLVPVFFALGLLGVALPARAVDNTDFVARTQQDVIDLCTATDDDPMQAQAIAFCHGFLIGAYTSHQTERAGADAVKIVCPPDPAPSRAEGIGMYIDWAKAHPEYANEPSIESLFKFLTDKWPCPAVAKGAKEGAK